MKKINIYIATLLLSVFAVSCSVDDVKPQGVLDQETAASSPDKLVTAAYAMLGNDWYSYPFNPVIMVRPPTAASVASGQRIPME